MSGSAELVTPEAVPLVPLPHPAAGGGHPPVPRARRARNAAVLGLYALALFATSALLFAVEPMFTKMVLPLLGGTPSVWNTCLLFFQGALLVGYLYAHLTSRWLSPRTQGIVHVVLLLLSLAVLPVAVSTRIAPPAGAALPIPWLLA